MNRAEMELMRKMYGVQLDTVHILLDIASNANVFSADLMKKLAELTDRCVKLSEKFDEI